MGNNEYDPGTPYDPSPRRRRRRREWNEQDDAWAAADEDDFYDDGVEIEDLAAGYLWDDEKLDPDSPPVPDWHDGENWSPPVERARERSRSRHPRYNRGAQVDRDNVYSRSPTYYRDRMKRGEYGEFHSDNYNDAPPGKAKHGYTPAESLPGSAYPLLADHNHRDPGAGGPARCCASVHVDPAVIIAN